MIEGVRLKELVRHADDRGYFEEILRDDDGLLRRFGQASVSKTYPGVIKAFHYHKKQDDLRFFPVGNAQCFTICVKGRRRRGLPTSTVWANTFPDFFLFQLVWHMAIGRLASGKLLSCISQPSCIVLNCPEHGVVSVATLWAPPKSGFTYDAEFRMLDLAKEMPVVQVAMKLYIGRHRAERMVSCWVSIWRRRIRMDHVTAIAIDEKASTRATATSRW